MSLGRQWRALVRVERWKKLHEENAGHTASAAERRRKGKAPAQRVKQAKRADGEA